MLIIQRESHTSATVNSPGHLILKSAIMGFSLTTSSLLYAKVFAIFSLTTLSLCLFLISDNNANLSPSRLSCVSPAGYRGKKFTSALQIYKFTSNLQKCISFWKLTGFSRISCYRLPVWSDLLCLALKLALAGARLAETIERGGAAVHQRASSSTRGALPRVLREPSHKLEHGRSSETRCTALPRAARPMWTRRLMLN